jgi:uncharacterized membrane protein YphA (DoxX/SURF4 family)
MSPLSSLETESIEAVLTRWWSSVCGREEGEPWPQISIYSMSSISYASSAAFLHPAYCRQDRGAGHPRLLVKAGFKPPATQMYIAGAIEIVLSACLVFDIYTRYIGIIAFIHLLVAAAATYKVTKSWIWVIGGIEYGLDYIDVSSGGLSSA